LQHWPQPRGRAGQRYPRLRLRILPVPIRGRRRQAWRRVLYASLSRASACRDAGALQGPRLRPLLRLGWHVCAVRTLRGRAPGAPRRHLDLGQERNYTTWRLCRMTLAVRGIDADIKWNNEGSFHKDEFRDERFDFILANPPFNVSDWGGERLRED